MTDDRRERKARRTRDAIADAALELILEHGSDAVGVEDITNRVDVSRRTFSRYFATKEEAALDFLRRDLADLNAALAGRPADERLVDAYVTVLHAWVRDDAEAWQRVPRRREILRLAATEPAIGAAYRQIIADAQDETARVAADRLGLDADSAASDLRPVVLAGIATAGLTAAGRAWVAGADGDLPGLVERVFALLHTELSAFSPTA
ncbi:TetR family transcriptional regulator [Cellulomonas sp. HZM]|uniref:TetR family transcriptional regulator n=1 Tax=Cellulomonas sp. HZM TaxID=1454010 RepID=UPI000A8F433B|nr:TetR family transcriptional regulator [Cellulomonas sp. HZM]